MVDKYCLISAFYNCKDEFEGVYSNLKLIQDCIDKWIIVITPIDADDNSVDLANQLFRKLDIDVEIIVELERGIYRAWNTAILNLIHNGSNAYVLMLSADDVILNLDFQPHLVKDKINAFNAINLDTEIDKRRVFRSDLSHFSIRMGVCHPACVIHLEFFKRHGLYDESYNVSADWKFLLENRSEIVVGDSVNFGVRPGGFSRRNYRKSIIENLSIQRKYIGPLAYLMALMRLLNFLIFMRK